MPQKIQIMKKA